MRHYDEALNQELRNMNNKIQLTDDEKQDLLIGINEKITVANTQSKGLFNKTIAFALTGIAVALFIILVPLLSPGSNNLGQDPEPQAILPDNYSDVDDMPFDLSLPSYLPFEPESSTIQVSRQDTLVGTYHEALLFYRGNNSSYIEIDVNNREGKQEVVRSEKIETDKHSYEYTNNGTVQNLYFEASGLKYTITSDTNASKDELIKTADSFVPHVQLDDAEVTDQSAMLEIIEYELEVGMSENEVTNLVGESDAEFNHGTKDHMHDYWRYDLNSEASTYTPANDFVDFPAIYEKGQLDLQLFIKWEDGVVHSFSTVFKDSEDRRIKHWLMNEKSKGISKRYFPNDESEKQFRSESYPYEIPPLYEVLNSYEMSNESKVYTTDTLSEVPRTEPGDTFQIQDIIDSVEYNEAENYTSIIVEHDSTASETQNIWRFKGDLTSRISKGDPFNISLRAIAVSPDGIYTNLDYLIPFMHEGTESKPYPELDDFLE